MVKNENRCVLLCLCTLAALVFISFSPLSSAEFISYDDPDYVTKNPMVQGGLSFSGLKWALTTGHSSNWHPLTWLAHMLDWQVFGHNPGAHHLSNVLLHTLNAFLVFLLFQRMSVFAALRRDASGTFWRSGMVAALFALHPLHVESVAWVSEKKDLLSTFFGLLTIWAYVQFTIYHQRFTNGARKSVPVVNRKAHVYYALALVFFACGLMSKPMLVTLPFVLLLLDFWLGSTGASPYRYVAEKIPFFALSLCSCVVTFFVQQSGGAVRTLTEFSVLHRLGNAIVSYVIYLRKTICPSDLAVFYPPADSFSVWQILGAAILLGGISAVAVLTARSRAYFLTGWLWFLGMLVPVIGIVQVGEQALADRYTYLPLVGIFAAMVWGVSDLLSTRRYKSLGFAGSAAAIGLCSVLTFFQAVHWKNNQTLFGHAVAVTAKNYLAHSHLATDFIRKNDDTRAKEHLLLAVQHRPSFADVRLNLGTILAKEGNLAEAQLHFEEAIRSAPFFEEAHFNLAILFKSQGKLNEAAKHYTVVINVNPDHTNAHNGLAFIFAQGGDMRNAVKHYSEGARLQPADAVVHFNLATALVNLGETNVALEHYSAAVKLQPDLLSARYQLGVLLAERGRIPEAVAELSEVVRLQPDFADAQQQLQLLKSK